MLIKFHHISAPVVLTGQSYQPPNQPAYTVTLQTSQQNDQNSSISQPNQMPMPNSHQPHPSHLPYPAQNSSNFPQPSAPFANNHNNSHNEDHPPSYNKIDKF